MRFPRRPIVILLIGGLPALACASPEPGETSEEAPSRSSGPAWEIDVIDDFATFDEANWQDQRIWVNDETPRYVPDGEHGTVR